VLNSLRIQRTWSSRSRRPLLAGMLAFALGLALVPGSPAQSTHIPCDGQGTPHEFLGTNNPDQITGNGNHNRMNALDARDTLEGRGGNDVMCGEQGRDRVVGEDGADKLLGGDECDRMGGGFGSDELRGSGGHDSPFVGIAGCDNAGFNANAAGALLGDGNNDHPNFGGGIYGLDGRDYADGGDGTDWADMGADSDWCAASTTETILNCENPI
jgi:hypothetical protein